MWTDFFIFILNFVFYVELNNYKTVKSNRCQFMNPVTFNIQIHILQPWTICCKELHVACSKVPGSAYAANKRLSQQPEALLKNELPHLRFSKSFQELYEAIKIFHT